MGDVDAQRQWRERSARSSKKEAARERAVVAVVAVVVLGRGRTGEEDTKGKVRGKMWV